MKMLNNSNLQRKKKIDFIFKNYHSKMLVLRQKRDKIISDFCDTLKEEKLKKLRDSLK